MSRLRPRLEAAATCKLRKMGITVTVLKIKMQAQGEAYAVVHLINKLRS